METTLTVLDGYPVQIDLGDRYSNAHLFVRGQYVHPIIFAPDGQVFLKDAAAFDGTRRDFSPDEITALRALYRHVQTEEATRKAAKQVAQAHAAQRVLASTEAKLAGMDDVHIYDGDNDER
jgi:predicted DNA-binding transcriptional regulator YafY